MSRSMRILFAFIWTLLFLFLNIQTVYAKTDMPVKYKGIIEVDTESLFITNSSNYVFNIKTYIINDYTNKKLNNEERKIEVNVQKNGENIASNTFNTTEDTYNYELETSQLKGGNKVNIEVILYSPDSRVLARKNFSFKMKSAKYKSFYIETTEEIEWNLHKKKTLTIPIAVYYLDKNGDKKDIDIKNNLIITSSDGKTYIAKKMKKSKNKYKITISKDIVETGVLDFEISIKNTNVSYDKKTTLVDIKDEDVIEKIVLTSDNYTINVNETYQVNPKYYPDNSKEIQNIIFTSSNEGVAKVDKNGRIKGISNGTTTITIQSKYITKTFNVEVKTYLEKIEAEDTIYLEAGKIHNLSYNLYPKNATIEALEFSSKDETIATVSDSGIIEAINSGKTKITITEGDISATSTIVVLPKLEKIDLNRTTIGLTVGEEEKISIITTPNKYKKKLLYKYISSNETVVTVDNDGLISAVGVGTATITVAHDDISASVNVNVLSAGEVNFSLKQHDISISKELQIEDIINETIDYDKLTVVIDNETVLSYNNHKFIPKNNGTTLVTVNYQGKNEFLNITVELQKEESNNVEKKENASDDVISKMLYCVSSKKKIQVKKIPFSFISIN